MPLRYLPERSFLQGGNMKKVFQGVEFLSILLLLALTVMVFLQVVLRNLVGAGFVWVEELSRFLLLSMVLISAPVVFFRGDHVKFDLLSRLMSPEKRKIHSIILILLMIFFYGVYIYSHFFLMKNSGTVKSPSLEMPNYLFFGAGLLGAVLGVVAGIYRIYALIRGDRK